VKTQNVTLSILRKYYASKANRCTENTSLSGLLTQSLAEIVARQEGFEQARLQNLQTLEHGFDLGSRGKLPWKREDLHER